MFVSFKSVAGYVITLGLAVGVSSATFASHAVDNVACVGSECSKSVDLTITESNVLCEAGQLTIFWDRSNPSDYLVQCSCNCTSQMNLD
jgi:hypothetical protein